MDKRSLETCPAHGGERMNIDGHNFQHDSKVVFVEKAQGKKGGVLDSSARVSLSVVGETPGPPPPPPPRRQNTLRPARAPHVVHINALYF